jgi:methionyl-tRNA synthetase
MDLARAGNKYLADTEPWKLYKTDPEKVATILNIAIEITAALSYLCEPFLPFTSKKLQDMLNIDAKNWEEAFGSDAFTAGHSLGEASLLFDKIEDEAIAVQIAKLEATKINNTPVEEISTGEKSLTPFKDVTTYDDFSKMDLRVATIVAAEKVEKADKLLKLTLDTGIDTRTVVSGIALHFNADEIIGKQVTLLANLAPRKIRGIESNGMILMAEDADGKLVFVQPARDTKNGSTIA